MAGTVRIVVYSWGTANEEFANSIRERVPSIQVDPVRMGDAAELTRTLSDRRVAGCVLVLTHDAWNEPTFTEVVNACLAAVTGPNEFRLFVHLDGSSWTELIDIAATNKSAADLVDGVHIPIDRQAESLEQLAKSISTYWAALPQIQRSRRLDYLDSLSNRLLTAVQFMAFMFAYIGGVRFALLGRQIAYHTEFPIILFVVGIISANSAMAALSLRYPIDSDQTHEAVRLATSPLLRMSVAIYPIWIFFYLPQARTILSATYLLAGLWLGVLLSVTFRAIARRKRSGIRLAKESASTEEQPLIPGRFTGQFIGNGPLVPTPNHVFISYSRSSQWGSDAANKLHEALTSNGVSSFYDRTDIETGTSWWHKLRSELGRTTVFVQILDYQTACRPWPDAELRSATQNQSYCGLPSIVLVRNDDLGKDADMANCFPTVRGALAQGRRSSTELLRLMDWRDDVPSVLATGLQNFEHPALLDENVRIVFWKPVSAALKFLASAFDGFPGWLFIVCALGLVVWSAWSASHISDVINGVTVLMSAFALGATLRGLCTSVIGESNRQSLTAILVASFKAICFFVVVIASVPHSHPLLLCTAGLALATTVLLDRST